MPLAHLDRPFDYAVPDKFADTVQPGCRVRVRFSGQLLDGFVVSLDDASDFTGRLSPLSHVPSGEPVLTPQVARLARVGRRPVRGHAQRRPAAGAATAPRRAREAADADPRRAARAP